MNTESSSYYKHLIDNIVIQEYRICIPKLNENECETSRFLERLTIEY